MAENPKELFQQYNEYATEIAYRKRTRAEEANKVIEAIGRISPEELAVIKKYIPSAEEILKSVTRESLMESNKAALDLQNFYNRLLEIFSAKLNAAREQL